MSFCDFVKSMLCNACPFREDSDCDKYDTKENIIQELEDRKNDIDYALKMIKK